MIRQLRLAATLLVGRRFWLLALAPLLWLVIQALLLLLGTREAFEPAAAQNTLIALPVVFVSIFLGGRIIAGELDQHSLEIAYTVPGGAHRVWLTKLAAAAVLLVVSMLLHVALAYAFFTPFPVLQAIYGACQAVTFYLVLAMGFATLFRSEVAGAMASAGVLAFNGLVTGFGSSQVRVSPFWNPVAMESNDPSQVLAIAVQNRIGFVLVIAAIVALTFGRAERREKMLGG